MTSQTQSIATGSSTFTRTANALSKLFEGSLDRDRVAYLSKATSYDDLAARRRAWEGRIQLSLDHFPRP